MTQKESCLFCIDLIKFLFALESRSGSGILDTGRSATSAALLPRVIDFRLATPSADYSVHESAGGVTLLNVLLGPYAGPFSFGLAVPFHMRSRCLFCERAAP